MLKHLFAALAAFVFVACPVVATAQNFPTKPIRIIVPYPAGGGSDSVGRILAAKLSQKLGQQVLVENIAGAGGTLGSANVARAAADGYTLLLGNTGTNAFSPLMFKKAPYDAEKNFTPISVVTSQPLFIVVNASSRYQTLADLVDAGKKQPGTLYFSSSGIGGLSHLAGEMVSLATSAKFVHIPYKGAAPALLGVLSNDVVFHTPSAVDGVQQVASGKMRALAVTSSTRWAATPQIPTTTELGYPSLHIDFWYGLFAPANLPPAVLQTLSRATREVLSDPATKKAYEDLGAVATPTSPEDLRRLVTTEHTRYGKVISTANIQPE